MFIVPFLNHHHLLPALSRLACVGRSLKGWEGCIRRKQKFSPRAREESHSGLSDSQNQNVGENQLLRGTHAKETDAADNRRVLGRGQHVVGGAEEAFRGAAGTGALDNDSLGRHLEKSSIFVEDGGVVVAVELVAWLSNVSNG